MKGKTIYTLAGMLSVLLLSAGAYATDTKVTRSASTAGAKVSIESPRNGESVSQTFTVKFNLSGMQVAPAGSDTPNSGHHHLIIDGSLPASLDQPLGSNVKHFGGGQTETELTLSKGSHTLQLILGDRFHVPHNPPVVSEKITILVE